MSAFVLLAIALNLDALAIGVSYAIRNIKIPKRSLLFISLLSVVYTALASVLGDVLAEWLPPYLGGIFLLGLGLYTLISAFFTSTDFDFDASKTIDIREAAALSLALSLDAGGASLSFSLCDGFSLLLPITIGFCQLVFLSIGKKIGARISFRTEENTRALHLISGTMLTLFGVLRLVL
ncbi:MAG: hypothetical protein E7471_04220 [Ruminococcaceae bacterium]|nr:hypothetical protein [Oscillospiraceae bacterium]